MPGCRNFLRNFRGNIRKTVLEYHKGIRLSLLQAAVLSSLIKDTPVTSGMIWQNR